MRRQISATVSAGALLVFASVSSPAFAIGAFTVVDLGMAGGTYAYSVAINDNGQVVGETVYYDDSCGADCPTRAFLWTEGVGVVDLGTLGGDSTYVRAINNAGEVVGYSEIWSGWQHAFYWSPDAGMVDLGTLGISPGNSFALAINDAGQVVGSADIVNGVSSAAFVWTAPAGPMESLGTLGGDDYADAFAVNEAGQVVGSSFSPPVYRAFLYTPPGPMLDLGTLGGPESTALALNESGQVVGWSRPNNSELLAFSWTLAGGMVALDLGGDSGVATAVNDGGQVVGYSATEAGQSHAFVWSSATSIADITLGDRYGAALSINDLGEVVGYATGFDLDRPWASHAFVWTGGELVDLGTLGGNTSNAVAINDDGWIAGESETETGEQHATVWMPSGPPPDTEPPQLTLPSDMSVEATGPGGATVTYSASASDAVGVTLFSCTPPSGDLFPIGTTTVNCTTSDAAGNDSAGSFNVTVIGADDQLANLADELGGNFATQLQQVQDLLAAGKFGTACNKLNAFSNYVNAQADKKKITGDMASDVIDDVNRISEVIGCP